jgi:hypothetical protein
MELLDEPERFVPVAGLADDVVAGELRATRIDSRSMTWSSTIKTRAPPSTSASIRRGLPWRSWATTVPASTA